jgi:hypothetical protein
VAKLREMGAAKLVARLTKYKMADIGKGVANTLQPAKKYIKKYCFITLHYTEANKKVYFVFNAKSYLKTSKPISPHAKNNHLIFYTFLKRGWCLYVLCLIPLVWRQLDLRPDSTKMQGIMYGS